MKICWCGFTGPCMNEMSSGLLRLDPNMQFYIIGQGWSGDKEDYELFGTRKNQKTYTDQATLQRDLNEFDVIIYDTYIFSKDDCPNRIKPLIEGRGCPSQWTWWEELRAIKILFDGESQAGKIRWYHENMKFFDYVITGNPKMEGYYTYYGVEERVYKNFGTNNKYKVLYSGDCIGSEYRKDLMNNLLPDPENKVIVNGKVSLTEWIQLLNESKMYIATYSCSSGARYPMNLKQKDAKALLCGALPLTEEFPEADQFLAPGIERVVFKDFGDLHEKIAYYNTHEDERRKIVEAGKRKVLAELTSDKTWEKAFKTFNLIKEG